MSKLTVTTVGFEFIAEKHCRNFCWTKQMQCDS